MVNRFATFIIFFYFYFPPPPHCSILVLYSIKMFSADCAPQPSTLESLHFSWPVIPELQVIHRHFAPLLRLTAFGEETEKEVPHTKDGNGETLATSRRWKKASVVRRALVECGGMGNGSDAPLLVTPSVRELLRPPPPLELCRRGTAMYDDTYKESFDEQKKGEGGRIEDAMQHHRFGPPLQHLHRWWKAKMSAYDMYAELVGREVECRRHIDAEWEEVAKLHRLQWSTLQRAYIRPETKQALTSLEEAESRQRMLDLIQPYQNFCVWVYQMIPVWETAVREKEEAQLAKQAAMEAARKILEEEIVRQTSASLPSPSAPPFATSPGVGYAGSHGSHAHEPRGRPGDGVQRCGMTDASLYPSFIPPPSATPSEYSNTALPTAVGTSTGEEIAHQNLRRQAIQMLVRQEEAIKARRTQELQRLKDEENCLRKKLEEREIEEKRRARSQQYQVLAESEALAKMRLEERKRLAEIKREERRILLEHLKAEEEILRKRIRGYEEERQQKATAAREQEARLKQKQADRLRIEEEILLQRVKEHENRHKMEAMAAAKAKEEREAHERKIAAWRQFEEEKLQRAIAQERERAYQRQQEEALEREYRRRFFSSF